MHFKVLFYPNGVMLSKGEWIMNEPITVLDQNCASRKTLEIIANKWTVLVVYALGDGTKRYSEIKNIIDGITHKMLAQTLRRLENDGIVRRVVYPVIPPHVEYNLTPLGETLIKPLWTLCAWAENHYHEVETARLNAVHDDPMPEAEVE
jgi:DNA-binding HxlR family transcriptional regulator